RANYPCPSCSISSNNIYCGWERCSVAVGHSEAMSGQLKKTTRGEEAAQQRASSSEEQQQEKINEVRGLLDSLTEEMPSFLSDATIRRFLRARSWSTEQATKSLKETVKWRRQYRPDAISWDDIPETENEARRTHVADYLDKNGRSVLVANVPMKVTNYACMV
uniref:CRAL/TRIO N-terminal domain-containing protein n=1 Tax=Aegilops tauschii subsp. strangulata TaxID=200361 RepID=A0A453QMY4_AEGTS